MHELTCINSWREFSETTVNLAAGERVGMGGAAFRCRFSPGAEKNSAICHNFQNCATFALSDLLTKKESLPALQLFTLLCNRKLVHYLLILTIGLMPALVLASSQMHHMDSMSSSPFGCDSMAKSIDLSCEINSCLSMAHACGASSFTGFIPANILGEVNQSPRLVGRPQDNHIYRSRLDHSIYRPPIA